METQLLNKGVSFYLPKWQTNRRIMVCNPTYDERTGSTHIKIDFITGGNKKGQMVLILDKYNTNQMIKDFKNLKEQK